LPRSGLSDNGGGMKAGEITEGLHRLGIVHQMILPRCAFANTKIETLWTQVEGPIAAHARQCAGFDFVLSQ
jgi:hypothetical protein